ncbi:Ig-like domain-containing protein [bacterium]|nr:Ig-like domain-containing protein [bacterium]
MNTKLILLIMAILSFSCSQKKKNSAKLNFLGAGLSDHASNFEGGLIIYGVRNNTFAFAKKITSDPKSSEMFLDNGVWQFYGVGWKGNANSTVEEADNLAGDLLCSKTSTVNLNGGNAVIDISFSKATCADNFFVSPNHITGGDVDPFKMENCTSGFDASSGSCPLNIGSAQSYKYTMIAAGGGISSACINAQAGSIPTQFSDVSVVLPIRLPFSYNKVLNFPIRIDAWDSASCGGPGDAASIFSSNHSVETDIGLHELNPGTTKGSLYGASSEIILRSSALSSGLTPPLSATSLVWSEGSLHNAVTINANWNLSTSSGIASQSIQYYSDGTCITTDGSAQVLGASVVADLKTGANGNSYSYKVTTTNASGLSTVSLCSSGIAIDTAAPASATVLGWTESSPHNLTTVNASWTPSVAGDIASQSIQYYSDATCSTMDGSMIALGAAVTTNSKAGLADGDSYTYEITTTDNAGNLTVSPCSSGIVIDTAAPASATVLAWTESSPHNLTTVNASWTPSVAGDIASQSIQYYSDATCSTMDGSMIALGAAVTTNSKAGLADGDSYTYEITTTDNAGNSLVSSCSTAVMIDITPPNLTSSLSNIVFYLGRSVDPAWIDTFAVDSKLSLEFDETISSFSGEIEIYRLLEDEVTEVLIQNLDALDSNHGSMFYIDVNKIVIDLPYDLDPSENYLIKTISDISVIDSAGNLSTNFNISGIEPGNPWFFRTAGECPYVHVKDGAGGGAWVTPADGSYGSPWIICESAEFDSIGINLDQHFRLGRNIDYHSIDSTTNHSDYAPFGKINDDTIGNAFTGSIDGNGLKVSGLILEEDFPTVGIFSNIGAPSGMPGGQEYSLKNITFENMDITSTSAFAGPAPGVGIIAGMTIDGIFKNVIVKNSTVTAPDTNNVATGGFVGTSNDAEYLDVELSEIIVSSSSGGTQSNFLGGLIGYAGSCYDGVNSTYTPIDKVSISSNSYLIGNSSTLALGGLIGKGQNCKVENSSFSGSISSSSSAIGGLIGILDNETGVNKQNKILHSFTHGTINSPSGTVIGGLVGLRTGITLLIEDSYSSSDIYGQARVGGLIGESSTGVATTINRSYVLGTVSGDDVNDDIGGILGFGKNIDINNSFVGGVVENNHVNNTAYGLLNEDVNSASTINNFLFAAPMVDLGGCFGAGVSGSCTDSSPTTPFYAADTSWASFWNLTDVLEPTLKNNEKLKIRKTSPEHLAAGVGLDTNLVIEFNSDMSIVSGQEFTSSAISIYEDASLINQFTLDSPNVILSGNKLYIIPTMSLASSKNYHIQILPGVLEASMNGNQVEFDGIADNTVWSFTTP